MTAICEMVPKQSFMSPGLTFTKICQMESKRSSESLIMMTEIVLPNDTNVFGSLMGGRLMYWMDIAAAISAQKHCNSPVVTASVDNISFENPINLETLFLLRQKLAGHLILQWKFT